MTDFKAKVHQIRFRLGLCPRLRWGSLQRSPDALDGFGAASRQGDGLDCGRRGKGEGKGKEGKWRGWKGRAPKLLLPSEPCYATARRIRPLWLGKGEPHPHKHAPPTWVTVPSVIVFDRIVRADVFAVLPAFHGPLKVIAADTNRPGIYDRTSC